MNNVTEEVLRKEIIAILEIGDWSYLTTRKVREQLEETFGINLTDRRSLIDKLVMEHVNSQRIEEDEEEANYDEEQEDLDNFEEKNFNDFEEDLDNFEAEDDDDDHFEEEDLSDDFDEENLSDDFEEEDVEFEEEDYEEEENDDGSGIQDQLIYALWSQMMLTQDHNNINQVGGNGDSCNESTGEENKITSEDLQNAIISIVDEGDWSILTAKKVREQLEGKFGVDLTSRGREIRNFTLQYVSSKAILESANEAV